MTELGVLFTYHKKCPTTIRNFESFKKNNPYIQVFPLFSNSTNRILSWRNVDLLYYEFYKRTKHKCRRWLLVEWDVFCNCDLEEFYGDSWDCDFVCGNHHTFGDNWFWFREVKNVPRKFWRNLHGISPLACTLISDDALSRITDCSFELDFDLFCELRLGILANYCNIDFTTRPSRTISWRKLEMSFCEELKSLWHPKKE